MKIHCLYNNFTLEAYFTHRKAHFICPQAHLFKKGRHALRSTVCLWVAKKDIFSTFAYEFELLQK